MRQAAGASAGAAAAGGAVRPRAVTARGPAAGTRAAEATRAATTVTGVPEAARARLLPLRDATLATAALVLAVWAGSRGFRDVDPALLGYLGATLAAAFATAWRASAFWRRPASAFYGRALVATLRSALHEPRLLRRIAADAGRDLAAQGFIRRRSTARWAAHLLLSLGTIASFAITLPLVFGWMHFRADGERVYRLVAFGVPTLSFDVEGRLAWLFFHGLALAGVAVLLGAAYFLVARLRLRRLAGATSGFAIAPLVLLLAVAATGLALPATRDWPAAFAIAAALHEASVIVLLVAIPFGKLAHVLLRPLQLGARAVRSDEARWTSCEGCGAPLAPAAQHRAVDELLARRGIALAAHIRSCPACRRKGVAAAQARLVGAHFQPRIAGARPGPARQG